MTYDAGMSLAKKLLILLSVLFVTLTLTITDSRADSNPLHRPMIRTPLTHQELLVALRDGHNKVFGTDPSNNRLASAWGQVAFENAAGRHSYDHNLGNVGPSASDQPTFYSRSDKHRYRAFDNFVDGAAAYWEVIKRCTAALAYFDQGNPTQAAASLKRCNYFEADLALYTKNLVQLFYYAKNTVIPEEEHERERKQQEDLDHAISKLRETAPAPETDRDGGCD